MASFGKGSKKQLDTLDTRLKSILIEAIKIIDFTIVEGHREKEKQNEYFARELTTVKFPNSKHNSNPSKAVDIAPYVNGKGIVWHSDPELLEYIKECTGDDFSKDKEFLEFLENIKRWFYLKGIIKGIGHSQGVVIRGGEDWDRDNNFEDQSFDDLPHFEIKE